MYIHLVPNNENHPPSLSKPCTRKRKRKRKWKRQSWARNWAKIRGLTGGKWANYYEKRSEDGSDTMVVRGIVPGLADAVKRRGQGI